MTPTEDRLHNALRGVGDLYPAGSVPAMRPVPRRLPWRSLAVAASVAALVGGVFGGRALLAPDEGTLNAATPARLSSYEISVYFCAKESSNPRCHKTDATQDQVAAVTSQALNAKGVSLVRFESKEDAYARFKETFKNSPGLVDATKVGDLPPALRVRVPDPADIDAVARSLGHGPGVDQVVNERALSRQPVTIPPTGTPMPMGRD